MRLTLPLHTIVMTVGPSMCGKSTFSAAFSRTLEAQGIPCPVLSSDDIRRSLLRDQLERDDPRMLEASSAAFDLLHARLKAETSFPINVPFAVVDTTALDERFRDGIARIGKEHGYGVALVVFDYPVKTYFQGGRGGEWLTRQVERFRKDVLPNLKSREYTAVVRIKQKNTTFFSGLEVEATPLERFRACHLVGDDRPVAVIGDVHERVDMLNALLAKMPEKTRLVFVGDLFDKGGETEATLDRVEQLAPRSLYVTGNHESYIAKRLRGETDPCSLETEYFTSLRVFFDRPDLAKRFLAWFDTTLPFVEIHRPGRRTVFVTHAPCEWRFLGKIDEAAQRAQRNLPGAITEKVAPEAFRALMTKAIQTALARSIPNYPLHVFGHIAHGSSRLLHRNLVFLDTGADGGRRLSAFLLEGPRHTFLGVDGPNPASGEDLPRIEAAPREIDAHSPGLEALADDESRRWVQMALKNGIKFVSGTMAPAPAKGTDLESLTAALALFRREGFQDVVVQPKYMGSRCQILLHRNAPEKDFATSRNGWKIREAVVGSVLESVRRTFLARDWWKDTLLLDGELCPWSLLGENLIHNLFGAYGTCVGRELAELAKDPAFAQFNPPVLDVRAHQDHLARYEAQLTLYGVSAPSTYRPFATLAIDGVGHAYEDQVLSFSRVSDDRFLAVNLADPEAGKAVRLFFDQGVEAGLEGVVIKPRVPLRGKLPSLKVRNPEYLRLVYGYDTPERGADLIASKNIRTKLRASIEDYDLGADMLEAPPEIMEKLLCRMAGALEREKAFDPRL